MINDNSWTRRDAGQSSSKSASNHHSGKRKHPRSPSHSRSRSRSPATSYRSHASSRGRSHSRSISPANKRRRRDSSLADTNGNQANHKTEKHPARSPSPPPRETTTNGRHRSRSVSSSNSDRSITKSPAQPVRSVHRLPSQTRPTNAVHTKYTATSTNGSSNPVGKKSRNRRKGKEPHNTPYQTTHNGDSEHHFDPYQLASQSSRHAAILTPNRRSSQEHRSIYERPHDMIQTEEYLSVRVSSAHSQRTASPPPLIHRVDQGARSVTISMPPPASIPPAHVPRTGYSRPLPISDTKLDSPAHNVSMKGISFKPIGKASSSLKKFFPGDEDDMDVGSDDSSRRAPQSRQGAAGDSIPPSRDVPEPSSGWHDRPPPLLEERRIQQLQTLELPVEPPVDHYARSRTPHDIYMSSSEPHHSEASTTGSQLLTAPLGGHSGRPSPHTTELSDATRSARSTHDVDAAVTPMDNETSNGPSTTAPSSSTKDLYKIVSQVGEGTFGKVYKARNTVTGTFVALKRIRMESEKEGFPVTAMREIKLLQSLRHQNVVRLYEMMVSNGM